MMQIQAPRVGGYTLPMWKQLRAWLLWVPPSASQRSEFEASISLHRILLLIGGAVYFSWWFLVELLLPNSFNPLGSRLAVVSFFWMSAGLTYRFHWAVRHVHWLFHLAACVITLHYFYLLYGNRGTMDWQIGTYFTVVAISAFLQSRRSLLLYNAFVLALAVGALIAIPHLRHTLFLGGLVTIGFISYLGLHHRVSLNLRLSRSSERFKSLFDSVFEGIVVHDRGRIVEVNDTAVALLGYRREALIGSQITEYLDPSWLQNLPLGAQDFALLPERFEAIGISQGGVRLNLEVSSKSFRADGKRWALVAFRDVTARKHAEEERQRLIHSDAARAAAEEAVRKREEFMAIAAHELRTPLTSLQLHVQRLLQKDGIENRTRQQLESCERSVKRLVRLTRDLLELSRIELGDVGLELDMLDLRDVIQEVSSNLGNELRGAGCSLDLEIHGDLMLRGDRFRLEQVLSNLTRNALLYGKGQPVTIVANGSERNVFFKVRDHGIGIAFEDQSRVFQRFERAVSSRHYGGLGLGLYIAKQIVEAHGGQIHVESIPSAGATFSVTLPRRPIEPQAPGRSPDSRTRATKSLSS